MTTGAPNFFQQALSLQLMMPAPEAVAAALVDFGTRARHPCYQTHHTTVHFQCVKQNYKTAKPAIVELKRFVQCQWKQASKSEYAPPPKVK